MAIFARSNQLLTDPTLARQAPGRAMYRADFGLGDTPSIVGQPTATGEGLTPATFVGTANGLAVSGGQVIRGAEAAAGFVGLPVGSIAGTMSWLIKKLPTAGTIYLDLFRNGLGSSSGYRLEITSVGKGQLATRIGGIQTNLGSSFNIAAGDTVGCRWVGGLLTALVNNSNVASVVNSDVPRAGYHGIAWTSNAAGFELDTLRTDAY